MTERDESQRDSDSDHNISFNNWLILQVSYLSSESSLEQITLSDETLFFAYL